VRANIQDPEKRAYYLANCRCMFCGKSLKDPISQQYGIGPTCREKYGASKPQKEADWKALAPLAAILLSSTAEVAELVGVDYSKAIKNKRADEIVRVLLRWIAENVNINNKSMIYKAISAIQYAGWQQLSESIYKRLADVSIEYTKASFTGRQKELVTYDAMIVETKFSWDFVREMRKIKCQFYKDDKTNRKYYLVAVSRKKQLWEVLKRCFPNSYGHCEGKGGFIIGSQV